MFGAIVTSGQRFFAAVPWLVIRNRPQAPDARFGRFVAVRLSRWKLQTISRFTYHRVLCLTKPPPNLRGRDAKITPEIDKQLNLFIPPCRHWIPRLRVWIKIKVERIKWLGLYRSDHASKHGSLDALTEFR